MNESLVTRDLLKAFGDKCKKIFRFAAKPLCTPSAIHKYFLVKTNIPYNAIDPWVLHISIEGKGLEYNSEYTGDIKFSCNISRGSASTAIATGNGFSFIDNMITGISFVPDTSIDPNNPTLKIIFTTANYAESVVV